MGQDLPARYHNLLKLSNKILLPRGRGAPALDAPPARTATIALELAGGAGVVWPAGNERRAQAGIGYLVRQTACIGGGTTEMARNVISERVLLMPRERDLFR